MRLLTFHTSTGLRLGVSTSQGVLNVSALSEHVHSISNIPESIEALCTGGPEALAALQQLVDAAEQLHAETNSWLLPEESLTLGPCVPSTSKIICVGLNYRKHAAESGMAVPTSPVLFAKYANSLAGAGEEIPLPRNAVQYDYEAELALVIGRKLRNISEEESLEGVLGYCNANDVSARDLQFRTNQWLLGKALDKFLPIGPYLVTADEVADPQKLKIRCEVNGQERQNSSTADMIFSIAYVISYLSQYMTLEPGDIISTGTPEGVISGMTGDKVWLVPGDKVVVEVEGLGRLMNSMA